MNLDLLMAAALLVVCCAPALSAERDVALFRDFAKLKQVDGAPEGWTTWSPRPEITPRFSVDLAHGRDGGGALRIAGGGSAAAFGSWRHRVNGISAGQTYRFTALYRTENVPYPQRCVSGRLDWLDEKGARVRPPDYALDEPSARGWTPVEYVATAPEKARSVVIELAFGWCAGGSVLWDQVRLAEELSRRDRAVRVMTVYQRPRDSKSAAESVEAFCRLVEGAADQHPDVVCLPEGITVVGTDKSYAEVSEPLPGPTTRRLGELAKKLHTYVAAGLFEREGGVIYNTAVLIDRRGELAGRYRKTHLPREEVEGGLTPGDSYPVFKTDFGTLGLMICWDSQFPEPARALGLEGAELVLLPIWGGSDVLCRARAIENHFFLASASYDMRSFVVDPTGEVLAEATPATPVVTREIHLDRKILQPWLGDMEPRTWKERRPDIALPARRTTKDED